MTTRTESTASTCYIEGEGGDTIVMVHGWPDTHRLWDEQVAHLAARHRCVRFTLPGFGGERPRRGYSLDELVTTLQRVVEARPARARR